MLSYENIITSYRSEVPFPSRVRWKTEREIGPRCHPRVAVNIAVLFLKNKSILLKNKPLTVINHSHCETSRSYSCRIPKSNSCRRTMTQMWPLYYSFILVPWRRYSFPRLSYSFQLICNSRKRISKSWKRVG